jgi:UDP-perosamine 4-acetyltransferase
MMQRPFIIIGAGGHARVLLDTLLSTKHTVIGLTDPQQQDTLAAHLLFNHPLLGSDEIVLQHSPDNVLLCNGLGMIPGPNLHRRMFIYQYFRTCGYTFPTIVHPSAILAGNVDLKEGTQIMAGSVIQTGAVIGENTIINTRVTVDHDAIIGNHVHLAPGTTVSGDVSIGNHSFVGAGSTIIQGVNIAENCIVAAGSVIIRDIPEGAKVIGVPARII